MSNQNSNNNCDKHVHEITGSTALVSECQECNNHRFCTVSEEAIRVANSHVHEVKFDTDFSDGHSHEFCGKTGLAIEVGNGKHVHFICDSTETEDGHVHRFQAATLIDSPIDFPCHKLIRECCKMIDFITLSFLFIFNCSFERYEM